jgi:hypothetical protein
MNILKESNFCFTLRKMPRIGNLVPCAIWEDIYSACRQILYLHLESLKKGVKDDEEKKSLNKKRKAVTSCSQEGRNGGQKRMGRAAPLKS